MDRTFSWEYLAGLFDGEGNVCTYADKGYPRIKAYIAQSGDRGFEALNGIQVWLTTQGISSKVYERQPSMLSKQTPYRLYITQKDSVIKFLESVRPYLHIKRAQLSKAQWQRELYGLVGETVREPREWPGNYIERCII